MDIQRIVLNRWREVIEEPFGVPLYTALAASNLSPPYAVAEYVSRIMPIGSIASMAEHDVRITVYATDERFIQSVFEACGLDPFSIVPTGFHRVNIGDGATKATSRIAEAGLPRAEPDPPMGGGKCFSRVLTLAVRTGTKRG